MGRYLFVIYDVRSYEVVALYRDEDLCLDALTLYTSYYPNLYDYIGLNLSAIIEMFNCRK